MLKIKLHENENVVIYATLMSVLFSQNQYTDHFNGILVMCAYNHLSEAATFTFIKKDILGTELKNRPVKVLVSFKFL